jgi:EmrB/QacA subfamily drug resistance transporter
MGKGIAIPRGMIFFLVATGVFLSTMDSSMLNVALPSIMRTFNTTLAVSEWVVLIYLLTITVSLLIIGHVSDCVGQGRIYLFGMLVFSFGSLTCYLAPSLSLLIAFRFIQALGAAMMMSSGPAIIKNVFPPEHLGRSLGFLGIATSIGLMTGPVLSGFLIKFFSWRMIFLVTIPISMAAFLLGRIFVLPKLPERSSANISEFDWYGSLLWCFLVSLSVLFTSHIYEIGYIGKIIWGLLWLLVGGIFWMIEKKHPVPLLPLLLFKRRYYGIAMATVALSFTVLFIVLIIMPFFMDYILGVPVDTIGYVMMAVPLTLFVLSPVSGWLYDIMGARFLTTSGLMVCCLAVIQLCFLCPESTPFNVAWRLALLGAGQSIFLSPNTASVLGRIEKQYTGVTSGMLATSRNIGMLAGVAIAGMLFTTCFFYFSGGFDLKDFSLVHREAFMYSFRGTLLVAAVLALAGGVLSVQQGMKGEEDNW